MHWTDLRLSPNQTWLVGGFELNDREIKVPPAHEISTTDYKDMSPFGNWQPNIPVFTASSTDNDTLGKIAYTTMGLLYGVINFKMIHT